MIIHLTRNLDFEKRPILSTHQTSFAADPEFDQVRSAVDPWVNEGFVYA